MGDERANDQTHPEQGEEEDAKHGSPFFRFSADTENAPVDIHEGIGEERQERELKSSGEPPKTRV